MKLVSVPGFAAVLVLFLVLTGTECLEHDQLEYVIKNTMQCLKATATPNDFLTRLYTGQRVVHDPGCFVGCVLGQDYRHPHQATFDPIQAAKTLQHLGRFGITVEQQNEMARVCGLWEKDQGGQQQNQQPSPSSYLANNPCQIALDLYNCYATEIMKLQH